MSADRPTATGLRGDRRGIIVLGMHRSGTSVLARATEALGVDLGAAGSQEANVFNAKGYFEHPVVVSANDTLLQLFQSAWHRPLLIAPERWETPVVRELAARVAERLDGELQRLPEGAFWGVKDPRMMRLLPFWRQVFERLSISPAFLMGVRHPMAVAGSLADRDALPMLEGLRLWLEHHVLALGDRGDGPLLVCDFDAVTASPRAALARMAEFLGLPLAEGPARSFAEQFLDPQLRRQRRPVDDAWVMPGLPREAAAAYRLLSDVAEGHMAVDGPEFIQYWQELWAQHAASARLASPIPDDSLSRLASRPANAPAWRSSLSEARALEAAQQLDAGDVPSSAICLHLHYPDVWDEIAARLERLRHPFSLYVSLTPLAAAVADDVMARFPLARVFRVENRGRDIAPFLVLARAARAAGHRFLCKIHGKKSVHRPQGARWRDALIGSLLGDDDAIARVQAYFHLRPAIGMVGPAGHELPQGGFIGSNAAALDELGRRIGVASPGPEDRFFAGSMFWCRVEALAPLLDASLDVEDFPQEAGQIDGTLAHAIERIFSAVAQSRGFRVVATCPEVSVAVSPADEATQSSQVHFDQLLSERADAVAGLRQAELLACERLAEIRVLDQRLAEVHAALEAVKDLSLQRLETIKQQDVRIGELHKALDELKALSIERLKIIESQERRIAAENAAQEQATRLSLERLARIQEMEKQWVEMVQNVDRLKESIVERDGVIAAQAAERAAMLCSLSWRITRPLRWLSARLIRPSGESK